MKSSLKYAIKLFSFSEKLLIYLALSSFKLRIKTPKKALVLYQKCNDYVRMIEQGVSFSNNSNGLIKASLLINQKPTSVFLRENSSDFRVFESVIINEEYKIVTEKVKPREKKLDMIIVDAGSNIGLTSIYLNSFHPYATFIIIEPDTCNFSLLKKNIAENKINNAKLFKNALWVNNEKLMINDSFRDGKEWSLTVEKADDTKAIHENEYIEGISLKEICLSSKIDKIDLLKIDIEGAERFLFTDHSFLQALNKYVSNVIIEIHDEFKIRETINQAMGQLGFTQTEHKDITFFKR